MVSAVIGQLHADPEMYRLLKFQYVDLSGTGVGPFIPVSSNEPQVATYGAAATAVVPDPNATDFLTIQGSTTKTVRIKSITLSGEATAAANIFPSLVRRSAVDTGGTAVNPLPTLHDTGNSAVTAAVRHYTANPSGLGASVGVIHAGRLNVAPASNGAIDRLFWQFTWLNDQAVVLRGNAQLLCVTFPGTALPAGIKLDYDIEWTEE